MSIFTTADILLPNVDSMEKWAVIACDQFVSQPEYWQDVRKNVADAPSALHLIWPEAELEDDAEKRIAAINANMAVYLQNGLFTTYPDSFVYVERTLQNGSVRRGIVGAVDLAAYDYNPGSGAAVCATERTVTERIPPRVNIRRDAPLELPHVLLLCDDPERRLVESVTAVKDTLPVLYDFELMAGGGHVCGRLVSGGAAQALQAAIRAYESGKTIAYAVGDGNHSLAAAKECSRGATPGQPARHALVELMNIHETSLEFEPIHRLIVDTDAGKLLAALEEALGDPQGHPVKWFSGREEGTIRLRLEEGQLCVAALQNFLDGYLRENAGTADYIHGDDTLADLARKENAVGFLLPAMGKPELFPGIAADGVLPRKTFSMGHAREKRYYLEARIIRNDM